MASSPEALLELNTPVLRALQALAGTGNRLPDHGWTGDALDTLAGFPKRVELLMALAPRRRDHPLRAADVQADERGRRLATPSARSSIRRRRAGARHGAARPYLAPDDGKVYWRREAEAQASRAAALAGGHVEKLLGENRVN